MTPPRNQRFRPSHKGRVGSKPGVAVPSPLAGADLRTDDTNVSELVRIANRRSRLDRLGLKAKLCERGANPRQGWDGVILTSHTNPKAKAIHLVSAKNHFLKLYQPSLLLLKDTGLESMVSSLHSFINNLFSLVSASESHPTLALPIQGGKACDALSGRFSGFIYLFACNYLPLPSLYHFPQPLSHLVTQSLNHFPHQSLNHLITTPLIPPRRSVC